MTVTERNISNQDDVKISDIENKLKSSYLKPTSDFRHTIRKKMDENGWTHAQLAARVGVSRVAVTNWLTLTGNFHFPTYETLLRLCRVLDLEFLVEKNTAPDEVRWVPVLEWNSVLSYMEGTQIETTIDLTSRSVPASVSCSRRSFALCVRGESMSPQFPEGSIIIVDPERTPKSGNHVIIQLLRHPEVLFRQYLIEGSEIYLKPLNPQFPMSVLESGEYSLLGVVVQKLESCI